LSGPRLVEGELEKEKQTEKEEKKKKKKKKKGRASGGREELSTFVFMSFYMTAC